MNSLEGKRSTVRQARIYKAIIDWYILAKGGGVTRLNLNRGIGKCYVALPVHSSITLDDR
jgi:hypothetical protein